MTEARADRSLWVVLIVCIVFIGFAAYVLTCVFRDVAPDSIAAGLTNVGTIGGIVSGLSLSGTAVLTLSGRYATRLITRYGAVIRFVLFGGFSALVLTSLLCAVAVMWSNEYWVKVVLAISLPVIFVTLVATALMINSAFAWQRESEPELQPDPYGKR